MRAHPLFSVPALAAAVLGLAPGDAAAQGPGTISISPSRTSAVATSGRAYGPITLTNATPNDLRVRVVPSLLRQDKTGAILVDLDADARRRAAGLITPQVKSFTLGAGGGARSVLASLRRVPRAGSFYGGLLFISQPAGRTSRSQQIRQVFRINGSLYLDPPRARRRVDFARDGMRGEQAAPRALRIITPLANRGNWAVKVSGEISVADSSGRVRFRRRVRTRDVVLPGATVEVPVRLTEPVLEAGVYTLRGAMRGGGRRFTTGGRLELFGPNAVATTDAKLLGLETGDAYYGEPLEVRADFRNTGNVKLAPRAEVLIRPLGRRGPGRVLARRVVQPDEVAAGKTGTIETEITTPADRRAYEVVVRVMDDRRLLDSRSTSLVPRKKPPLLTRIGDWIRDNALGLVGALLIALLAAVAAALAIARRGRREQVPAPVQVDAQAPAAPRAAPPPAPSAAPASPGRVDVNRAPVEELMHVPGLGRRAAERIVEYRDANGPFTSVAELAKVEGFHSERVARVSEHLVV